MSTTPKDEQLGKAFGLAVGELISASHNSSYELRTRVVARFTEAFGILGTRMREIVDAIAQGKTKKDADNMGKDLGDEDRSVSDDVHGFESNVWEFPRKGQGAGQGVPEGMEEGKDRDVVAAVDVMIRCLTLGMEELRRRESVVATYQGAVEHFVRCLQAEKNKMERTTSGNGQEPRDSLRT